MAGPSGGASSSAETSGATDNASAGEADGRDATAVSPPPARVFTSLPPATAPPANGINALDAGVAETERARAERERADQEAARASAANADAGFEIRPRATAPPQGSPFATQAPWWGASSFVSDPNAGAGQFTAPRVNEASAFQSDPNSGAGRFTTEWPPFGGYIESPLVSVPVQPQSSGTGQ